MSILIADDHTLFRDTLITYLSIAKPLQSIITVGDFDELFHTINAAKHKIDFMLIDFSMPGMAPRDAFRLLGAESNSLPFAMMSGIAEQSDIDYVMSCGARGYVPKTMSGQVLLQAIDKMLAGQIYLPARDTVSLFSPPIVSHDCLSSHSSLQFPLTPREQDVLLLLEQGMSNNDIASALKLRPVTVKLHVRGILRKLNLDNRTQAALWSRDVRGVSL